MASRSSWNYYGDELNDVTNENHAPDYRKNNKSKTQNKYCVYERKIMERIIADSNR